MLTARDMTEQLQRTLDGQPGYPEDFDLDGIVGEIIDTRGLVDLGTIEHDEFWEIVRKHDRTQQ